MATSSAGPLLLAANVLAACAVVRGGAQVPPSPSSAASAARLDPVSIGRAAGSEPSVAPDGVVRLSWPRTDVAVTVDGTSLRPSAGLSSWAALTAAPQGALLMGDTVVFEDEVDAAMDAAFANGLEVSGLHNHFFFDQPKVYFLHIGGSGEPARLAAGVRAVWDAIRNVRRVAPNPADSFGGPVPVVRAFDAAAIERIVGHPAAIQDGVAKVIIGRDAAMHGVRVGGSMGLTTWAAFSGSDTLAAIDGDFIMAAAEVQPVLHALRRAGFHIVALHNHMIGETPPLYFTHFWAKGSAAGLARGFRSVLDAQASVPPETPADHRR